MEVPKLFRLNQHLKGAEGDFAKVYTKPYKTAVNLLHQVNQKKGLSPEEKVKLLSNIQKSIVDEIENYYDKQTLALRPYHSLLDKIPDVDRSKLVIDADAMLLITVWILWQSKEALP